MEQGSSGLPETPIRAALAELRGKLDALGRQRSPDRESLVAVVADMRAQVDRLEAEMRGWAADLPELPAPVDAMLLAFATLRQALDLLGAAGEIAPDGRPLRRLGRLTRIERDRELRAFVDARIGTMSQTDLAAACRSRFGRKRAPSLSGLNRYIHIAERERRFTAAK